MHRTESRAVALCRSARASTAEPALEAGVLFDSGSRTGRLMQSQDWSTTALGPAEDWPENLKTPLRLMLASSAPTFIWWGRDLIHLHNDACARLFGRRRSIGRPAAEIRQDIWAAIGREVVDVLDGNAAISAAERRVIVTRNGRERELFCTFSLTPIRDEWGCAIGVFGVGADDTAAVLTRQRLAALRSLQGVGKAENLARACEWAAAALASNVRDVPFALLYLGDDDGHISLAGSAGALPDNVGSLAIPGETVSPGPLEAFAGDEPLRRLLTLSEPFRSAALDADGAAVLPLRFHASGARAGFLVVGLAKRRPFDDEYRTFLTSAAGLVSTGLTAAAMNEHAAKQSDEERRRDEFLAMLAHELRNPLAPIRSAAELLAYVDSNPMSLPHARAIIERQLTQLVRLVDDLLDVSRISRGTLELKRGPLDLRAAVASAVESIRPMIDAARHELAVHLPDTPVPLHGDHARLTQAIANLLSNAAQYTNPGGHIDLAVHCSGAETQVRISDDGIGIDDALMPRVFEMFTQGDQRIGEPRHGLGIGLAIARRLIELHGGSITAHSAGRSRGSEFVVRLPVHAERAEKTPLANGNGRHLTARRILVADDNTDAATAMAEILGVIGHEVRTAEDGLEAIEIAEQFRPELILLDIGMPRLDGYEACRRIRQRAWGRDVPIYAVTGWGQPSDRRRTREAGFNAHLVKPVSVASIEELIARNEH